MENLKKKIQNSLTKAMKENDEVSRSTLRMLSAAILNKEKEKRYKIAKSRLDRGSSTESGQEQGLTEQELIEKSNLTDEEVIEVVFSEVKKRKESIVEFEKGKRQDLADKEKSEIEILRKYLPEQATEKEIKKIVEQAIGKVGAKTIKDMGKVMAEIMPKVKGKADGSQVSRIVKELLTPKE